MRKLVSTLNNNINNKIKIKLQLQQIVSFIDKSHKQIINKHSITWIQFIYNNVITKRWISPQRIIIQLQTKY